jgi:hypothetical protein
MKCGETDGTLSLSTLGATEYNKKERRKKTV